MNDLSEQQKQNLVDCNILNATRVSEVLIRILEQITDEAIKRMKEVNPADLALAQYLDTQSKQRQQFVSNLAAQSAAQSAEALARLNATANVQQQPQQGSNPNAQPQAPPQTPPGPPPL